MKKHCKPVIFLIGLFAFLLLCWWLLRTPDPVDFVAETLGVSLPEGGVLAAEDSHDNFLGDGHTYIAIQFKEDISEQLTGEYWHDYPMSENVHTALYGSESRSSDLSLFYRSLPEIDKGRWLFIDRHDDATNPADDSLLYTRGSYNYIAVVYDSTARTLHYFAFDT